MFQESRAVFFYSVSPVHMGAGSAVGVIDNPIQREKHSDHPVFAGSGLKGALRHSFESLVKGSEEFKEHDGRIKTLINRLFGPGQEKVEEGKQPEASDYAGCVSFGDAQLVVFPVRSLRGGFVYATCPYALARLHRLLALLGKAPDWAEPPSPASGTGCTVRNESLLDDKKSLHLEVFQFTDNPTAKEDLTKVADWLAASALPAGASYDYFRNKLKHDLVLLHDEDFKYFVQNATIVEPHVSMSDNGTAKDGSLHYTENLPPEALLVAPLMASAERAPKDKRNGVDAMDAGVVRGKITNALSMNGGLLQVGGDATTGRGLVVARVLEG
jgi:CRISPR-associated protein Cmr4